MPYPRGRGFESQQRTNYQTREIVLELDHACRVEPRERVGHHRHEHCAQARLKVIQRSSDRTLRAGGGIDSQADSSRVTLTIHHHDHREQRIS